MVTSSLLLGDSEYPCLEDQSSAEPVVPPSVTPASVAPASVEPANVAPVSVEPASVVPKIT